MNQGWENLDSMIYDHIDEVRYGFMELLRIHGRFAV